MSFLQQTLNKSAWGFDPRTYPGCVLWLDGADRNMLCTDLAGTTPVTSQSDKVGRWKDKSSNSNHATATQTLTRPNVGSNIFGIYDPGSTNVSTVALQFGSAPISGTGPFTAFGVIDVSRNFSPTNYVKWYGNSIYNVASNSISFDLSFSSTANTIFAGIHSYSNSIVNGLTDNVNICNSKAVISYTFSNTTLSAWRYSSNFKPTASTTYALNVDGTTPHSIFNDVAPTHPLGVYEIIIYNTLLSTAQRQSVEGYLRHKWNSSPYSLGMLDLSSGNPYASRAPAFSEFDPRTISNLVLWVDPLDISYSAYTAGTLALTRVSDKSGKNTTITIGGAPKWSSNGLCNRACFDMSGGRLTGAFVTGSNLTGYTNTTFIVGKWDVTPGAGYPVVAYAGAATGSSVFYRALDRASGYCRAVAFFASVYVPLFTDPVTAPQSISNFFICTSSNPGVSGQSMAIDMYSGFCNAAAVVGTNTANNGTHFFIGADGFTTGYNLNYFPGKLGDVLVYNRNLTSQEKRQVEGYLAWKWGGQGSLPTSTPFSSAKVPPNTAL